MALQKEISIGGYTPDYIKIQSIEVNTGKITVVIYKDQTYRATEGSEAIRGLVYQAPVETFSEDAQKAPDKSVSVLAYDYLKTLDEFSDVVDC